MERSGWVPQTANNEGNKQQTKHTLMDMRTDLTAVPHANLGYHFLRVQVKPNGGWGSSNGSEAQSASTKSTSSDRQDDGGPCTSAELKGINGHQLRLIMRPGAPSRYVFTTAWMGLRWPMPSKCPWALCLKQNKTIQRNPCDYKGHTRRCGQSSSKARNL